MPLRPASAFSAGVPVFSRPTALNLWSSAVSSRTLAVAAVLAGLLAGAWLAGCDSGHRPTVRQTTLAAGEASPPADTSDLPEGHPPIERPQRKRPQPRPPAAPEEKPRSQGPAPESTGSSPAADQTASNNTDTALPEPKTEHPVGSVAEASGKRRPEVAPGKGGEGSRFLAGAAPKEFTSAGAAPKEFTSAGAAPKESGGPHEPAAAAASGHAKGAPRAASSESRQVHIGHLRLEAPKAWLRKKPPVDFILAEFVLPRAPGDPEDAQLTVTTVGPNNPQRLNQLREELKKSPGQATVEYLTISGVEVILVDASANYGEMPGVFAPETREGRYRVLNAIVPVGEKLYFVNCSGPEKTVGNYARQFRDFLLGMKADMP